MVSLLVRSPVWCCGGCCEVVVIGTRSGRIPADDTVLSGAMLDRAVNAILKNVRLDRRHDVPYLAGYSRDGKTIYIDKSLPKILATRGRRVRVDRYVILHEAVEKALLDQLQLHYQHAHQIALRVEQAAVRADGIAWREYDRFMKKHLKEAEDDLRRLPVDLDIKPYRDEHDRQLLTKMQAQIRREKRK
jgi:hypothetical protein